VKGVWCDYTVPGGSLAAYHELRAESGSSPTGHSLRRHKMPRETSAAFFVSRIITSNYCRARCLLFRFRFHFGSRFRFHRFRLTIAGDRGCGV
jgi:hypothetical protein